uniref:Uncharacterized protein n=1 Tax=Siphoviridae sp. ctHip2 TaxID=2827830 RepID=A0A8S5RWC9_9CAUD|nr:MAG TPA: hypothetical protein [Siphoviridae sp. ctHip2]
MTSLINFGIYPPFIQHTLNFYFSNESKEK